MIHIEIIFTNHVYNVIRLYVLKKSINCQLKMRSLTGLTESERLIHNIIIPIALFI